jgi:hypothetical protein
LITPNSFAMAHLLVSFVCFMTINLKKFMLWLQHTPFDICDIECVLNTITCDLYCNILIFCSHTSKSYAICSSSSISLSCDRSIASSKVLERDCPGKVIMW